MHAVPTRHAATRHVAEATVADIATLAEAPAAAAPRYLAWLTLLPLLAAMLFTTPVLAQRGAPETFAPLAERVLPAVVNISTTQTVQRGNNRSPIPMPEFPPGSPFEEFFRDFFERQQRGDPNAPPRRATSLGSGFVVDATGFIVTNNHVIDGADEIRVTFQDEQGTELVAELIGRDPETDLALLKVDAGRPLPALGWGDSDRVRVGDWVVAVGNPFGLGGTVTAGIISARSRDINAGRFDDFLQTDASINRGNSGGPLVDLQGNVVGINTAIFSQTGGSVGIGFAIPATLAKNVIAQLRETGKVRRGWLGVQIRNQTDESAQAFGLPDSKGAIVSSVTDGGPAKAAGIEPGDVILTFDGRIVENSRALPRIVAETAVGKRVPVVVFRRGERRTIDVVLGEFPAEQTVLASVPGGPGGTGNEEQQTQTLADVGLELAGITPDTRRRFDLREDVKGVVVTEVTSSDPQVAGQLQTGDVIVEVSQEEVANPDDVVKRVAAAKEAGQRALLLLIERRGELLFVAVPIPAG